jgi:inner membrane protein
VRLDAAPRPVSPFNWTAIVFDGERYHYAHINTRRTEVLDAGPDASFLRRLSAPYRPVEQARWQVREQFGDAAQRPLARTVWEAPEFGFYRWFAMFPVLDQMTRTATEQCVGFRDLRFEIPGRDAEPFRYGLCRSSVSGWQLFEQTAEGRRWLAPE